MDISRFEKFLSKNDITFGVIAYLEDNEVKKLDKFGDINLLIEHSIVDKLVGDIQSTNNLNKSLDGQILPQIWGQGKVAALIFKPNNNIIIGLFYEESRSAIEQYKWSKVLNSEIIKIFNC